MHDELVIVFTYMKACYVSRVVLLSLGFVCVRVCDCLLCIHTFLRQVL